MNAILIRPWLISAMALAPSRCLPHPLRCIHPAARGRTTKRAALAISGTVFGAKGAAGAILVLALVSIWLTLNGLSPFLDRTPERSVVALQLFLIGVAVPAMLLSAAVNQL